MRQSCCTRPSARCSTANQVLLTLFLVCLHVGDRLVLKHEPFVSDPKCIVIRRTDGEKVGNIARADTEKYKFPPETHGVFIWAGSLHVRRNWSSPPRMVVSIDATSLFLMEGCNVPCGVHACKPLQTCNGQHSGYSRCALGQLLAPAVPAFPAPTSSMHVLSHAPGARERHCCYQ